MCRKFSVILSFDKQLIHQIECQWLAFNYQQNVYENEVSKSSLLYGRLGVHLFSAETK